MISAEGITEIAYFDCAGGGQVVVDGNFAYIGHMDAPHGTTVVDVSDPRKPRSVASIPIAQGLHSHKVRVANGVMLVNQEINNRAAAEAAGLKGGLIIYDVADPTRPREISRWECGGLGVHRFTFDGRYAYISPEMDGYVGNIVMILDLADPCRPTEVGRWWMPGQWTAGGEVPTWPGRNHRCHHPIRMGDRLYVSYWQGGFVILDISDMSAPKFIGGLDWSPPYPWPTHSTVPVPFTIAGRSWMIVADEDVMPLDPKMAPEMAAFLWMVDITDPSRPVPVGSFQVDGVEGRPNPGKVGCHQPVETITGTTVPAAWFGNGLRIIDISNPHRLTEVAHYVPDVPSGAQRVCSNDVYVDSRGIIYLIDRNRGLWLLEQTQ
ncbi:MAG TPA: hypothetical protein VHA77_18305 [Xanthobacteraceae bacterium]|jgi:hypothetical protein|nr:hypothetical protein [Xanthobacteraceae bacterium]